MALRPAKIASMHLYETLNRLVILKKQAFLNGWKSRDNQFWGFTIEPALLIHHPLAGSATAQPFHRWAPGVERAPA